MNNPLDPTLRALNDCGCCAGTAVQTPAAIDNRPGLPTIAFRPGIHSQFKATLLAALSSHEHPALRGLRTRESNDFTIALLDAFAATADVLTFYSERIANEAYLRTATERRSVLELARAIGYELAPGVAARVLLAFTVEGGRGAPGTAIIPQGTKVQSIPGPGEKPQTFETSLEFHGRAAWNELRPRLREPPLQGDDLLAASEIFLEGVGTNLKSGDVLVLSKITNGAAVEARRILRVDPDRQRAHTKVTLETSAGLKTARPAGAPALAAAAGIGKVNIGSEPIATVVGSLFLDASVSGSQMRQLAQFHRWDIQVVQTHLNGLPKFSLSTPDAGVFALRASAGFFGHNAPKWKSLPHIKSVSTTTTTTITKTESGETSEKTEVKKEEYQNEAYPISWDTDQRTIWEDSQGREHVGLDVFLERSVPELIKGSWVVLETADKELLPLRAGLVSEVSLADYALSAKCTGLKLQHVSRVSITAKDKGFKNRTTTAHLHSEPLTVIGAPIETELKPGDSEVALDRVDIDLVVGQVLALEGENHLLPGTTKSEFIVIADIRHSDVTILTLRGGLKHSYIRSTVTLNANVVSATHGETTQEVLGSGEAAQPFQRFTLKQKPLTYAFPPDAARLESSLEVWVDDVKWREADTFYNRGPKDRVYLVRRADDGTTTVQFGDGQRGARLPTGRENVRAVYRKGIGLEGIVKEEQISLMLTQPLGVKGVINPLAPQGAEDPQSLDDVRVNAPRTVLTLDRVVSLQDYEDFARDFPGVEKAHAAWTWSGQTRGVLLTLLGPDGLAISNEGQPAERLRTALARQGIARVPVRIVARPPSRFAITGTVRVDADRAASKVEAEVRTALRATFSFAVRQFGQGVALSEVIAVIQNVPGVAFVDVIDFQKTSFQETSPFAGNTVTTTAEDGYLPAHQPANGADSLLAQPAELLILDETSLTQLEVKAL